MSRTSSLVNKSKTPQRKREKEGKTDGRGERSSVSKGMKGMVETGAGHMRKANWHTSKEVDGGS